MKTIIKGRWADCDVCWDEKTGEPTSSLWYWAICDDGDLTTEYERFDSLEEAEKALSEYDD